MYRKFCLVFVLFVGVLRAQNETIYFPDNLNIQPFTANVLEPRLGFLFQTSNNSLRMDIGNSIDAAWFNLSENEILSVGFDLFTYTKLRSEDNFKFPVEAVDYLFGVNLGYKKSIGKNEYGIRVRISHISAHLADGSFDLQSNEWINGNKPFVYSREFIELSPYYKIKNLRIYAGFTYVWTVIPAELGKDNYNIGFDYFFDDISDNIIYPFIAYDFKLTSLLEKSGNHSFEAGIKFGNLNGKGFSLYYNYYSGKSVHGLLFNDDRQYSAIGINLDL